MDEIEERARKWLTRFWRRIYRTTRPSSYPYISGDGFRNLARHVYDETNPRISPDQVGNGDLIFVSTDLARTFFEEIDPLIQANYVLITHNSDLPADDKLISHMSGKMAAWFAQNNTHSHEKVVPIPIGLENLHHYVAGIPQFYTELSKYDGIRKNRILSGFNTGTNTQERGRAREWASRASRADSLPTRLGQKEYLQKLTTYKFILSPPGNGLDTHRTWEAMYLGVVPIVKDSIAMRSYEALGIPLWILGSWEELASITEQDLESRYEELMPRFSAPVLFMDYWRRRILHCSEAIRDAHRPRWPRGAPWLGGD